MIFDMAIYSSHKLISNNIIDVLYSCSLLVVVACAPEFLLTARSELQGSVLDLKFLVRKAAASARHPRCYDRVSAAVEEVGCLLDGFPPFSMNNLFTIGRGTLVQGCFNCSPAHDWTTETAVRPTTGLLKLQSGPRLDY
ncbi:hypothetical protein FHG87_006088 [Trinorchestia longiramus]|nr:hypothetical protein FHG87_006088 [Trinorchestia longiramus]